MSSVARNPSPLDKKIDVTRPTTPDFVITSALLLRARDLVLRALGADRKVPDRR